jgi:putative transposase
LRQNQKFGESFAKRLRRRRPRPGDKWYMDEVFIRIGGVQHYLWRAVDQDGVVLDILVQPRRDGNAAKRFFRRLLKGLQYVPRVIVTDKLQSYGVAHRQFLPKVEHRQSHPRRHLLTASFYRAIRTEAFDVWHQETCAQSVA